MNRPNQHEKQAYSYSTWVGT